jgi:hypothetical protein
VKECVFKFAKSQNKIIHIFLCDKNIIQPQMKFTLILVEMYEECEGILRSCNPRYIKSSNLLPTLDRSYFSKGAARRTYKHRKSAFSSSFLASDITFLHG